MDRKKAGVEELRISLEQAKKEAISQGRHVQGRVDIHQILEWNSSRLKITTGEFVNLCFKPYFHTWEIGILKRLQIINQEISFDFTQERLQLKYKGRSAFVINIETETPSVRGLDLAIALGKLVRVKIYGFEVIDIINFKYALLDKLRIDYIRFNQRWQERDIISRYY